MNNNMALQTLLASAYGGTTSGSGGGGGTGTNNYNELTNRPKINGITLSGNKTAEDLGIDVGDVSQLTTAAKGTAVAAINELDGEIGDISALTTTAKNTITAAVNELDADIGDKSTLTTSAKSNIVAAVNELDNDMGAPADLTTTAKNNIVRAINELDSEIGNLPSLTTLVKTSLVAAINEHDAEIGTLANLTTAAKTALVLAINELDGDIGNLAALETTAKTAVVEAINEINGKLVPEGGTEGQILVKKTDDDYDLEWVDPAEGSTIDTALSATSENPVQNKAIYATTGNKANLTTTAKSNLVSAINEHDTEIGDISELTTEAKTNLVVAVKELDAEIGNLATLSTSSKSTVVAAINELNENKVDKVTGKQLSTEDYTTAEKTKLADLENTPIATAVLPGKIKPGNGVTVAADGTLSVQTPSEQGYVDSTHVMEYNDTNHSIEYWDTTTPTVKESIVLPEWAKQDEVDVLVNGGAKNLMPNDCATATVNGITFTKNNDGSMTINGTSTATGNTFFNLIQSTAAGRFTALIKGKSYIISTGVVLPTGLGIQIRKRADTSEYYAVNEGESEKRFTWNNDDTAFAFLVVRAGATIDNVTVYPMVRDAAILDDTFVPYAMDNATLTKEKQDAVKNYAPIFTTGQTSNGVTYTPIANGGVRLNGTATGSSSLQSAMFSLPAGTYTASDSLGLGALKATGANVQVFRGSITGATRVLSTLTSNENTPKTATLPAANDYILLLNVRSGNTFNNVDVYPAIIESSRVLERDVLAELSDTGRITLEGEYMNFHYRKKNGIVSVVYASALKQQLPTGDTLLATLPTGFRPSNNYLQSCFVSDLSGQVMMIVTADGKITARATTAIAASKTLAVNEIFPVA